jgi:hypothetical protein
VKRWSGHGAEVPVFDSGVHVDTPYLALMNKVEAVGNGNLARTGDREVYPSLQSKSSQVFRHQYHERFSLKIPFVDPS